MKNEEKKLVKHEDYAGILDFGSLIDDFFTLFGCSMNCEASQLVVALSKTETEEIAAT